jgi:sulfotransferase
MPTIFYQSSLPRAGSTLLQNIMGQNPAFHVTPTSGLLELVYTARRTYTTGVEFRAQDPEEVKKAFLAFCRGGMESYARALTEKPYLIDKSRGWGIHYDFLRTIFGKEPKIICMVRDLRQILSSMEKKFRQTPERHRAIENHQDLTGITTYKRALSYLQGQPVGLAIERLIEIHQRGWIKKILVLRYEDLTTDPETALKKVYNYLGVPQFAHDFTKVKQITHEDDEVFGTPGLHDIRSVVTPQKADFQDVLGSDVLRHVYSKYGWYFKLFGYALPEQKTKIAK